MKELNIKVNLLELVEEMENDLVEILTHLDQPDHVKKYAICLALEIRQLRLIGEE